MTSLAETFPESWTVRRARDAYLAENGFTVEAYDDRWTSASFFGIPLKVPNTKRHRWAIMLHDLHHVATGYGTDLVGEGEISAWELRGLRPLGIYVASIVMAGTLAGAVFAPRRALGAWRAARSARSLFELVPPDANAPDAYEALLDLTVGELRARLGVPAEGLAREPRGLHDFAPKASSAG